MNDDQNLRGTNKNSGENNEKNKSENNNGAKNGDERQDEGAAIPIQTEDANGGAEKTEREEENEDAEAENGEAQHYTIVMDKQLNQLMNDLVKENGDLKKRLEEAQRENERIRRQAAESINQNRAETERIRRRVESEIDKKEEESLKTIFSYKDDLERAVQAAENADSSALDAIAAGVQGILQKMNGYLENNEVEPIDVRPGDPFDPDLHEALAAAPHPEYEKGRIIEAFSPGYKRRGTVLRYAQVVVASGAPENDGENGET